jgi:predicted permease
MRILHRLVYRALLVTYPKSFREDYGRELTLQLEDDLQEKSGFAVWYRLIPDTLQAATTRHLDLFRQDIWLALRMYRLRPWTSALIVALLGLGVGATLAAFEATYSLIARPLPYPDGSRLVTIYNFPTFTLREQPTRFQDLTRPNGPLDGAAIYVTDEVNLAGGPVPIRAHAAEVSPWFFSILRRSPYLGAWFSASAADGSEAVISHGLWQQLFGGDPRVLGRKIELNGVLRVIVGVAPPEIDFPRRAAIWVSASRGKDTLRSSGRAIFYDLLGRLKPGVSIESTQQALQALAESIDPNRHSFEPENKRIPVFTLKQQIAGEWDKSVLLLTASVAMALLLTCCGIANLLLARVFARRHEVAVRMALGAPVSRLIRQFRTEMLCLTALGTVVAVLVYRDLLSIIPRWLPTFPVDLHPSGEALGVLALCGVLITIFLGFAPEAETALLLRGSLQGLHERRPRAARLLLAVQAALATVLLIGAGLFGKSLVQLLNVDLRLKVENVTTASVSLIGTGLEEPARAREYYERALHTLRELPGVQNAAACDYLPLSGAPIMFTFYLARGPELSAGQRVSGSPRIASASYFDAMGIRMLAGRTLDDRAGGLGRAEVVVNRKFAEQLGGVQQALRYEVQVSAGAQTEWARIVGVIADVRFWGPRAPGGAVEVYQGYRTAYWPTMNFVVKMLASGASPDRIRAALTALDPQVNVYNVRTLHSYLNDNLARPQLIIVVLGSFALFSWFLAVLALGGLVAHDVRKSLPEIGIRMALGASQRNVLSLFVSRHSVPVLTGTIVGLCAAATLSSIVRSILFEVRPLDTFVYLSVPAGFLIVAVIVTVAASFRATRTNPSMALRVE